MIVNNSFIWSRVQYECRFVDVTPLHPFARSLAIAEAIIGQLFPAILIGALVAMAMQSRPKS